MRTPLSNLLAMINASKAKANAAMMATDDPNALKLLARHIQAMDDQLWTVEHPGEVRQKKVQNKKKK